MFKDKLREAIKKHLAAETATRKSATKGVITRTVNSCLLNAGILEEIQEVLAEFDDLPNWIKNRFTPGSLYKEGDSAFGWYREDQLQAETIPVDIRLCEDRCLEVLEDRDGFFKAMPLPLNGNTVVVPYANAFVYAKSGYANACPLQWYRDAEGYKVERSVIPHGFWQPWKWWEGAWHWYLERRPELFEDFDCWGPSWDELQENHATKPQPDDAVLGDKNKAFWEARKLYLDPSLQKYHQ